MRHSMHLMTWFWKQASYFNNICCLIIYTLWTYWTSQMLVRYIQSSVCLRLSQFTQSSFMLHMGLWLFSFPISLMVIVKAHVLYHVVIIKSEVWPICLCLGTSHETIVCAIYVLTYIPFVYHRASISHTYHNMDINALYDYMENSQFCLTFHFCIFKIWNLHLILILNYQSTMQSTTLVLRCLAISYWYSKSNTKMNYYI